MVNNLFTRDNACFYSILSQIAILCQSLLSLVFILEKVKSSCLETLPSQLVWDHLFMMEMSNFTANSPTASSPPLVCRSFHFFLPLQLQPLIAKFSLVHHISTEADSNDSETGFSYQWKCLKTSCKCNEGAAFCGGPGFVVDLTTAVNQVEGVFTLICADQNPENCKVRFSTLDPLFPDGLVLDECLSGECARPWEEPPDLLAVLRPVLSTAEIVGVVFAGMLVFVILAGLCFSKVRQTQLRRIPAPPPRLGSQISFSNIGYMVKKKRILNGVGGSARPGRVLAILGPSGKLMQIDISYFLSHNT